VSAAIVVLLVLLIVYVFSQFGGRLSARKSLHWWVALLFLLFVAIWPAGLLSFTRLLGFQLVSNFVFATMIVFFIFQILNESASSTAQARRLREVVAFHAARDYLRAKAVPPSGGGRRVLVVFPCLNEQDGIEELARRISGIRTDPRSALDFCVVNDGSTDGTESRLHTHLPGEHTTHSTNMGVSATLLTAFTILGQADYDFVVQCDADGQHPVEQIPQLVEQARARKTDLLIGSRFKDNPRLLHESTTAIRRLGSLLVTSTLGIFGSRVRVTDPTSGFRVYSRRAALYLMRVMPDEYPEPESIALLMLVRAAIDEVPVDMSARATGVSSLTGIKGPKYMVKVFTALLGLRLRTAHQMLFRSNRPRFAEDQA
jgi:hypothetical protein